MNTSLYKAVSLSVTGAVLLVALLSAIVQSPSAVAQEEVEPVSSDLVAQPDIMPPGDVENLQAVAGDSEVTLTWNVAKDDGDEPVSGYKVYYGTTSVAIDFGTYEFGPVDVGNKITYVVDGLDNGTTYYFAVTAYDEEGNESDNYSVEVEATPGSAAADSDAPTVVSIEVQDKNTVIVNFSEAVNLPDEDAETAFGIAEDGTGTPLEVVTAIMNFTDPSRMSVLLTTETQTAGATYILTAGIEVEDDAGNPIESGTSDTALFTGTDLEPEGDLVADAEGEEGPDTKGPELVDIDASLPNSVVVTFDEQVIISDNPSENFAITREDDASAFVDIVSAELNDDGNVVTLTTGNMEEVPYFLVVLSLTDLAGNSIDLENSATSFDGVAGEEEEPEEETPEEEPVEEDPLDVDPPEDAADLMAELVQGLVVELTWTPSVNSAGDLAEYVLYKSTDGNVFSDGVVLSADAIRHQLAGLAPGVEYFYKLTARDGAGNESDGVMTAFLLPETGPELLLLLAGSLGAGRLVTRRKRKK